jgi:hypothetical protein
LEGLLDVGMQPCLVDIEPVCLVMAEGAFDEVSTFGRDGWFCGKLDLRRIEDDLDIMNWQYLFFQDLLL